MSAALVDGAGYPVTGATAESLTGLEQAEAQLRCLIEDPVATLNEALALAPGMAMGHLMLGWLHLLGTEADAVAVARSSAEAARPLVGTARERQHLAALDALVDGRWHRASQLLEDLTIAWPHDALALQVGHQIDFFTGSARLLRDRIARALPLWDQGRPGYHALLGMYAFGLEENGQYDAALQAGERAVELAPRDSWAWHAVAHVHEMRNDPEAGIRWLGQTEASWAPDSFLAVHNHWHLALFHLERGEHEAVLARYDRAIGGPGSTVVLDLIDASALLWRLTLRGIDVGGRWQPLADRWAPLAEAGFYAFNDLHAMLAFVGAGRDGLQQRLLAAQRRLVAGGGAADNVAFTAEVGQAAARAIVAFGAGDDEEVIRLLRPLRPIAHRFGGSHAQRDLLDQTLLAAARRAGKRDLLTALGHERLALRPRDPLAHQALAHQALAPARAAAPIAAAPISGRKDEARAR